MYKLYLHNNEHFNNQIKGHDAVNSPLVKISEFTFHYVYGLSITGIEDNILSPFWAMLMKYFSSWPIYTLFTIILPFKITI